jgi:hypothetical protein
MGFYLLFVCFMRRLKGFPLNSSASRLLSRESKMRLFLVFIKIH